MKNSFMLGAVAFAAGLFVHSVQAAAYTTWEDGAVVPVGCQGAGDNNNNAGAEAMIFLGDGTIHGTLTPKKNNPSSWAIWRNYLITNGTVVVDGVWDDAVTPPVYKNFTPIFRRGVMLGDGGKLVISNKTQVTISPDASGFQYSLVDVKGLSFIDKDAQPTTGKLIFNSSFTVKRLPEDPNVTVQLDNNDDKLRIAIAGPDFMARMGTTFTCPEVRIFDDAYIPAGATLTIGANTSCLLSRRDLDPAKIDLYNDADDHTVPWTDAFGDYPTAAHPIDLSGALKVESIASGTTFSGKVTGHGNATISLRGGVTHEFAAVEGDLRLVQNNAGSNAATVKFNEVAAGTRLFLARGFDPDFTKLAVQPSGCPVADGVWYVFPAADGRLVLADFAPSTKLTAAINLASASYDDPALFGVNKMAVGDGVEVSAVVDSKTSPSFVMNAGTLKLAQDICYTATFWMDPSIDSTVYKVGTAIPKGAYDRIQGEPTTLTTMANGNDLIEAVADRRANHTDYCLRHTRHYDYLFAGTLMDLQNLPSVFPMRVKNGPNGLPYLSMGNDGSARRIQTSTSPIDPNATTLPNHNQIKQQGMVIMVFGSQLGGGSAVLGVSDASLNRPGRAKDDAIASATFTGDIWIDGQKMDHTASLSGGWQIITLDITGHDIDCFGWANKDYQKSAGQNYGEVLVFKESLTDAERVSVESYLAEKWGITAYEPSTTDRPAAAKAVLYGSSGTVEISGDIAVSGNYRGDFTVGDGAKLIVPAADAMPPEPTTEGLLYRFDPSQEGALTIGTDDDVKVNGEFAPAVCALWPYGYTKETYPLDDYYLFGVGSRRPFVEMRAGGFTSAARTWMNFAHPDNKAHSGNVLRFKAWDPKAYDDGALKGGDDKTVNIRTAIMVCDSAQGGGNLLNKSISATGSWGDRTATDATAPIWGSAIKAVKDGVTRLNGIPVNGTTTGFSGEAEVFVTQPTEAIGTAVLGRYGDTESKTTSAGGAILGEMLFYSTALTEDEIKTAEDYLLYKWMGVSPAGYGDLRGATVSDGTGTVAAKKAADLPKFGDDFTGTIAVTDETAPVFPMTVSGEAVEGALVAKGATLNGFTSATIDVSVPKGVYGTFALVDLKAVGAPITWTVNLAGGLSEIVRQAASVEVSKDGASVVLKLVHPGCVILLR